MKRISEKRPGYDCVRYPCGKNGCGTRPGASHGVHCEDWVYAVSDGRLALSLRVFGGVFPASVPPAPALDARYPTGAGLFLHVGYRFPGHDADDECEYVAGGRCFTRERCSYTASGDFLALHFRKAAGFEQPEPFWLALAAELREWAKSAPDEALTVEQQRDELLAACRLALPHLVNEPAADAVRAAIARATGT